MRDGPPQRRFAPQTSTSSSPTLNGSSIARSSPSTSRPRSASTFALSCATWRRSSAHGSNSSSTACATRPSASPASVAAVVSIAPPPGSPNCARSTSAWPRTSVSRSTRRRSPAPVAASCAACVTSTSSTWPSASGFPRKGASSSPIAARRRSSPSTSFANASRSGTPKGKRASPNWWNWPRRLSRRGPTRVRSNARRITRQGAMNSVRTRASPRTTTDTGPMPPSGRSTAPRRLRLTNRHGRRAPTAPDCPRPATRLAVPLARRAPSDRTPTDCRSPNARRAPVSCRPPPRPRRPTPVQTRPPPPATTTPRRPSRLTAT